MNEDIVKKTQSSLGKIIGKKPPLTEKLLNRPPFRFLHDIITSVIRETGFMKGLFTEKEGAAENITSKEEKVAFLQKAIDITVHVTGAKLSVRPSKIVAGLEAEKTNDFLQTLASAIDKKPDNQSCVKKILSGSGGGDTSSSRRDSKSKDKESKENDREQSADRRKSRSDRGETSKKSSSASRKDKENRDNSERKENKESSDRKDRDRDSRRHRDSSKDGRRESSRHRESSRDRKDKESSDRRDERRERSGRHRRKEEDAPQMNGVKDEPTSRESGDAESKQSKEKQDEEDSKQHTEEPAARIPRPSSAKGSRRRHREGRRQADDLDDDENEGGEHLMTATSNNQDEEPAVPPQVQQSRRLARPASARPAPPRVKRQEGAQDSLTERVDSARTQRVDNVIIDNDQHSDEDDDDNFMVEEGVHDPLVPEREETIAPPSEEDGQHGGLVKKILESKKEYAQSEQQQQSQTKTKIEKSTMNDATRHKEREMVKKEVDKLRSSIQTLTRSANPLGKIMDYVQEDLHSMQKERDMWRTENKKLADQIKREMGVTDGSIEPLKVNLAELEQAVSDQLDLIAAVKHTIIDNDDKITKMLSSVSRT